MPSIDSLLGSLRLEPAGEHRYTAPNAESGHAVIFGGQLLGQSIVAGRAGHDGKRVKTVHTVFARGGDPEQPVVITVDPMHAGRAFASSTVTISQGERLVTRSLVLLSADEPDLIRHEEPMPEAPSPDDIAITGGMGAWEVRVVGGVDVSEPDQALPAELDVWSRFAGAPVGDDAATDAVDQALLAFATDAFLIGTAMLPHHGVGQAQAHRTLSTGVITHTLTFHEPCPAGEWVLMSHRAGYAGHGRSYGRANIHRADGSLVASFVQDAMIRPREGGPGKL